MSTPTATLLAEIAEIGRDEVRGGVTRPGLGSAEIALRDWFIEHARARGLEVEIDRNGLTWAWWLPVDGSRDGAVATGSHLDSVPGGGALDGPLGVAGALRALDVLRTRHAHPPRPLALVVFCEEEGSRFGLPCLGSRLMTGAVAPERVRGLRDAHGVTFSSAARDAGIDPDGIGEDPEALAHLAAFVELHVEQGRGLQDLGRPVAIAGSILAHGRWQVTLAGAGDHAGTTRMADRHDPVVVLAGLVRAVRQAARSWPDARGTVGRVEVVPGGTNVIASRARAWIDLRHASDDVVRSMLATILSDAAREAESEGCSLAVTEESFTPAVAFDTRLAARLRSVLPDAPVLDTGAGHDAGILAARVQTAMLFARNPTGTSHAPAESCTDEDAEAGAVALADVLDDLLARPLDAPGPS